MEATPPPSGSTNTEKASRRTDCLASCQRSRNGILGSPCTRMLSDTSQPQALRNWTLTMPTSFATSWVMRPWTLHTSITIARRAFRVATRCNHWWTTSVKVTSVREGQGSADTARPRQLNSAIGDQWVWSDSGSGTSIDLRGAHCTFTATRIALTSGGRTKPILTVDVVTPAAANDSASGRFLKGDCVI